jgi:hypothetical protein
MRRRFVTLCLTAVIAILAAIPLSASASTSGTVKSSGFIIASGASGQRVELASLIRMTGAFNGVGKIVETANRPGDPDSVSRDDLVFPQGTLHLKSDNLDFSLDVNPTTCVATFTVNQTSSFEGGTGIFSHASGTGTGTVSGHGLARRASDGSCDLNQAPLFEVDNVSGTSTLSY